jgi:hypothetical protein
MPREPQVTGYGRPNSVSGVNNLHLNDARAERPGRSGAGTPRRAAGKNKKDFAYPTIFSEDPRYYRLGRGSRGKRLLHAAAHSFVAFRDNGNHMFNLTEWLGTMSAAALENTYHPGDDHTLGSIMKQTAYSVGVDVGFDVLREFWPEVARKLKIPFRDTAEKQGIEAHN